MGVTWSGEERDPHQLARPAKSTPLINRVTCQPGVICFQSWEGKVTLKDYTYNQYNNYNPYYHYSAFSLEYR